MELNEFFLPTLLVVSYLDVGCAAGISSFCTRWADVVVDPCQRTDREVDARQFAGA